MFSRISKSKASWWSLAFSTVFLGAFFLFGCWNLYWYSSGLIDSRSPVGTLTLNRVFFAYQAFGMEGVERERASARGNQFLRLHSGTVQAEWIHLDEDLSSGTARLAEALKEIPMTREGEVKLDGFGEPWFLLTQVMEDGTVIQVGTYADGAKLRMFDEVRWWVGLFFLVTFMAFTASGLALVYHSWGQGRRPLTLLGQALEKASHKGGEDEELLETLRSQYQSSEDWRRIADSLVRMKQRHEQLLKGMNDSLDHVAHDLRSPMTRLRGIAEMALQKQDSGEQATREALADCLEESEKVLHTLNAMMELAEAEAGALCLKREEVDLSDTLRRVEELYELVAEEKGVRLEVDHASSVVVEGDAQRIQQTLANLIDNAVKYTPSGGQVQASCKADGDWGIVEVRDTGEGIPEREKERIWERLYRGDKSRSEQRGLGLGLSFVKAVVEAQGGGCSVQSGLGKGSTFTVSLPLAKPSA